jgi:2-C-methyl-D-erythritol 4-phosphate cytidylyltransferase
MSRNKVRGPNALIVLSAGQGKRMGAGRPKMLLRLAGRPLLYWALKNIERCRAVHAVVLAVPPESRADLERQLKRWRFGKISAVVDGGKERADSTRNAVRALPEECRWVGIHDGARAFVAPDLVERVFSEARKTGAAILAVPSKDTVKVAREDGTIRETVPRSLCWWAQTPQVLRRDLAERLHARPPRDASKVTDDASLAEAAGIRVRLVPGSYENIKITTPEDLSLAASILKKSGLKS